MAVETLHKFNVFDIFTQLLVRNSEEARSQRELRMRKCIA